MKSIRCPKLLILSRFLTSKDRCSRLRLCGRETICIPSRCGLQVLTKPLTVRWVRSRELRRSRCTLPRLGNLQLDSARMSFVWASSTPVRRVVMDVTVEILWS